MPGRRALWQGRCCIAPKGVLATAQSSKAGFTIPAETMTNWAPEPYCGAFGRGR
jgi:hypothetical protein